MEREREKALYNWLDNGYAAMNEAINHNYRSL